MSTFKISKANSIEFVINTGAGTIRTGETIPMNAGYTAGYFCGQRFPDYCQLYDCSDNPPFQIEYELTGGEPVVVLLDNEGDEIDGYLPTNTTGNYYESLVDFSTLTCDSCYQVAVHSFEPGGNFMSCADSGTFETGTYASWGFSTGTNNVGSKSSAQAHTGTYSARIASPAVPVTADREIGFCTLNYSLTTGAVYRYTAWVFDDGTDPFIQNGRQVTFDISDFTDALTIDLQTVTPSTDGRDTWHQISITFKVGASTIGQVKIVTNANPQALGFIYIDDMSIVEDSDFIQEAISTKLCAGNVDSCYKLATYTGTNAAHQIDYSNSIVFQIRIPMILQNVRWEDSRFNVYMSSQGQTTQVESQSKRVETWITDALPAFMHQKIEIATKSKTFKIDGVQYARYGGEYNPDFDEDYGASRGEMDLILVDFNYQNTNC